MTAIDAYLAELDELLGDVDPSIREGLVGGIREELAGLTEQEATERLRALGDPAFVAASARAELPSIEVPRRDATWYPVVAVLLLAVGGFVVPVVGWIVGLVMLWASRSWRLAHKVVGTLLTFAGPVGLVFMLLPARFVAVAPGPSVNPLLPESTPFPIIAVLALVWLAGWIWLLVAAYRTRR